MRYNTVFYTLSYESDDFRTFSPTIPIIFPKKAQKKPQTRLDFVKDD